MNVKNKNFMAKIVMKIPKKYLTWRNMYDIIPVPIEVHHINSTLCIIACQRRGGERDVYAEDKMWRNFDLAAENKISAVVAVMRRAI